MHDTRTILLTGDVRGRLEGAEDLGVHHDGHVALGDELLVAGCRSREERTLAAAAVRALLPDIGQRQLAEKIKDAIPDTLKDKLPDALKENVPDSLKEGAKQLLNLFNR